MRTTLTLDDDVAVKLKKLSRGGRFKDVANRALRLGLQKMESGQDDAPCATRPHSGRPRFLNLDNVTEVIAENEGEYWR